MKSDEVLRKRFDSHLKKYGTLWKSIADKEKKPDKATDFLTAIEMGTTTTVHAKAECPFGDKDNCRGCVEPILEDECAFNSSGSSGPGSPASVSSASSRSTVAAEDRGNVVPMESPAAGQTVSNQLSPDSSAESSTSSGGSTVVAFDISHIDVADVNDNDQDLGLDMSNLRISEGDISAVADDEDSFEHLDVGDEASKDDDTVDSDESDDSSGGTRVRFDISHLAEEGDGDYQDEDGFEFLPPVTPSLRHMYEADSQVTGKNTPVKETEVIGTGDSLPCNSPVFEEDARGYVIGNSLAQATSASMPPRHLLPVLEKRSNGYETGDSWLVEGCGEVEPGDSLLPKRSDSAFSTECRSSTLKTKSSDVGDSWLIEDSDDECWKRETRASKAIIIESESENEWEDEIETLTPVINESKDCIIILSDDDDSSVESLPPARKPARIPNPFRKHRELMTKEAFSEFNDTIFNQRLSGVEVTWSRKLKTTAGLTRLSKQTADGRRIARIELNPRILDEHERLRSTLLHEMCHAAQWLVDGVSNPPHGKIFKKWANRAMEAIPHMTVTTTHDYEIQYKFAWSCITDSCGAIFKRQSRSIDVESHRCGRCKGKLIEINAPKKGDSVIDRTPKKKAPLSKYNQFVKSNSGHVRSRLEKEFNGINQPVTQSRVMKEIAKMWNEIKES